MDVKHHVYLLFPFLLHVLWSLQQFIAMYLYSALVLYKINYGRTITVQTCLSWAYLSAWDIELCEGAKDKK